MKKSNILCSVILLPIAITFYITWGFIHFVDGFFSPVYNQLGINVFGKFIYILLQFLRIRTTCVLPTIML